MPRSNRRASKKKSNVAENVKESGHGIMGEPMPFNGVLVTEFYANAWREDEPNPTFESYCRGKGYEGPYPEAKIEREPLKDGCRWVRNAETGEILHIVQDQLKPTPRLWSDFMMCNLLPRSNCKEIPKQHALLLYAICTGKSVDTGVVITNEIDRMAQSDEGELVYPSLITRSLVSQGVALDDDDDNDNDEPGPATIYPGLHNSKSRGARRRT
ncbi:hypothetical protein RIF29_30831 [Crotalaria pallida]|uniref:Putative plant transposon protein domain-containing protein n=1 Tax=Crotalaria pallida TaxID=3830 RepID=A0AAN9ENI4_CROPI